jgi:general secretion pathway protein G
MRLKASTKKTGGAGFQPRRKSNQKQWALAPEAIVRNRTTAPISRLRKDADRSVQSLHLRRNRAIRRTTARGFTLIELILAVAILLVLATAALPLTRVAVKRRKEQELRYSLIQIRRAIDRFKDAADKNQIQVKAGTEGYPPDLDTLVKGVQLTGASDKHVHFLSRVPRDPMTGNAEWGMRSVQDDTDSTSWGGQDVFDVYSKSTGTALDGTKYSEW